MHTTINLPNDRQLLIGSDLREIHPDGKLGRVVSHYYLRLALGLNPGKLPKANFGPVLVGDTEVYCLSAESAAYAHAATGKPAKRPHRVIARCNHCQKELPAGRFGQHLKVHALPKV